MKIKLQRIPAYKVTTQDGREIGMFIEEGDWEGILKLKGPKDGVLIVDQPSALQGAFSESFARIFRTDCPVEVDVLKASPSVMAELMVRAKSIGSQEGPK